MNKKTTTTEKTVPGVYQPVFNFPLRSKYIFLALTGFLFYANSIFNQYAFDDRGVILENTYVQMGFRGIPEILTHDSWASYYAYLGGSPSSIELSGGRYRPLSEIVFAVEQQVFGNSAMLPYFQHFVNVAVYLACIIAIFYFLKNFLFKKISGRNDISFFAAFLFAIHPVHTEVVANIKSLDELLSLLFIMLTFIYSLKYLQKKKANCMMIGSGSFLLALLSKEYAVTLLFFIPFLFYLVENKKPIASIAASIPYYGIFLAYLALRYNAVGFHTHIAIADISMNPYLYATPAQKLATEWYVLGKYLRLLFFPYPLSYDYSYNQIPYYSFPDISVILPMMIYLAIFIWGIILIWRKNALSFAIFFFLFNIFKISNLVLDIGAAMGERLVFHSSLGFVIIISYSLFKYGESRHGAFINTNVVMAVMLVIGVACFGETVVRNSQWKNDNSLFIHDVKVAPSSCLANDNAGWSYLGLSKEKENSAQSKAYLDSARKYLLRALRLNHKYYIAYDNLGDVYFSKGMLDSAQYCYDMVEKLNPNHPELKSNYAQLYFTEGLHLAIRGGKPREGIMYMKKALQYDSANANIWYNIAMAYHQLQQNDSAKFALMKTLEYKPSHDDSVNAERDLKELSK